MSRLRLTDPPTGAAQPFVDIPASPWGHFQLHFYLAVLRLLDQVAHIEGSLDAAFDRFPFLKGYFHELSDHGANRHDLGGSITAWRTSLAAWQRACPAHLPLCAWLKTTGLTDSYLDWFFLAGLVEEDVRFGHLFAELQKQPSQVWPTLALFSTWQPAGAWNLDVRAEIRSLQQHGLLVSDEKETPRSAQAVRVQSILWDIVRGSSRSTDLNYQPVAALPHLETLLLSGPTTRALKRLPTLMQRGEVRLLLVRGPAHNGRHTLLKAVAASQGMGVIEMEDTNLPSGPLVGALATMLPALPLIRAELGPGETLTLPDWLPYRGPIGVALGQQGGIRDPLSRGALTIRLPMPTPDLRRRCWQRVTQMPIQDLSQVTARNRLSSGNIFRAAELAQTLAMLEDARAISQVHVQQATRTLNRQALDTLATYLPPIGTWSHLAVPAETMEQLRQLEARCRHRETVTQAVSPVLAAQLNAGVRALFSGPSGTGKTLAARLLAGALGQDLYRLDLSAVVNKYIGETEKNLERTLARAEELDVILLLDEGDALLTKRTNVNTANDRYANLETNYLLQRLESFSGILLVTTNAMGRIDNAFQRRMDVVIEFRSPEAHQRWRIWQLHLPPEHEVPAALLQQIASRCELTGGQIRNAALYASLLALEGQRGVLADHLIKAVQLEYLKVGAVYPLPSKNGQGV